MAACLASSHVCLSAPSAFSSRARVVGDYRRLAAEAPKLGCRTMDILHVACAIQLSVDQFVSFDNRQKKLAIAAGLTLPDLV